MTSNALAACVGRREILCDDVSYYTLKPLQSTQSLICKMTFALEWQAAPSNAIIYRFVAALRYHKWALQMHLRARLQKPKNTTIIQTCVAPISLSFILTVASISITVPARATILQQCSKNPLKLLKKTQYSWTLVRETVYCSRWKRKLQAYDFFFDFQ